MQVVQAFLTEFFTVLMGHASVTGATADVDYCKQITELQSKPLVPVRVTYASARERVLVDTVFVLAFAYVCVRVRVRVHVR